MLIRFWDEEKIQTVAARFLRLYHKITRALHYDIPFYEICSATSLIDTRKRESWLKVLSQFGTLSDEFTHGRIQAFHKLVTELNHDNHDPFYNDLPDGFMDFARVIIKVNQRSQADIQQILAIINSQKNNLTGMTPKKDPHGGLANSHVMNSLFPAKKPTILDGSKRNIELISPGSGDYTPN